MKLAFLIIFSIASSSAAQAQAITQKGKVLATENRMTLYVYDKDTVGKSTCNGACAENWLPYADKIEAAPPETAGRKTGWGVIKRDDGKKMFTYDGKPLYLFKNDKGPGDTAGDGVGGVWHAARMP